jgi:phospholipid-binding lipoprotein MlaA
LDPSYAVNTLLSATAIVTLLVSRKLGWIMTNNRQAYFSKKTLFLFLILGSAWHSFCFAADNTATGATQPLSAQEVQAITDRNVTIPGSDMNTKIGKKILIQPGDQTDQPISDEEMNTPAQTTAEAIPEVKDPLEHFNRSVFSFNDKVDTYILKPIATFYNMIMPKPLNQGVHNFFLNINNLPNIANDILQFNFYQMANDLWRFGVNTTIGIGGLFDIGSRIGLMPYSNDFGLTLAKWGYQNSTYVVLPFFGPYTIRDALGLPVDYYVFSIYPHIHPRRTRYAIYGLGVIDKRAQYLQFQELMDEASIDKYVFTRNAYLQRRAYQIDENHHLSYSDKLPARNSSTQQAIEKIETPSDLSPEL